MGDQLGDRSPHLFLLTTCVSSTHRIDNGQARYVPGPIAGAYHSQLFFQPLARKPAAVTCQLVGRDRVAAGTPAKHREAQSGLMMRYVPPRSAHHAPVDASSVADSPCARSQCPRSEYGCRSQWRAGCPRPTIQHSEGRARPTLQHSQGRARPTFQYSEGRACRCDSGMWTHAE